MQNKQSAGERQGAGAGEQGGQMLGGRSWGAEVGQVLGSRSWGASAGGPGAKSILPNLPMKYPGWNQNLHFKQYFILADFNPSTLEASLVYMARSRKVRATQSNPV